MLTIRVGLYSNSILFGWVVFDNLLEGANNAHCLPADFLPPDQVEEIRRTLCRLPQINEGYVGKYKWRVAYYHSKASHHHPKLPREKWQSVWIGEYPTGLDHH